MPSKFELPDPRGIEDDVIAVGGDLEPGTILQAYRKGMFPMDLPDGRLAWWSPIDRAILPLDNLRITRSLRQSTRRFTLSVDADFEAVIDSCANPERPNGWITEELREAYLRLHELGWAHSIEVWDSEGELAGGLYGVTVGGLFAGESMFYEVSDASKVALVHLVVMLSDGSNCLLDVQWLTPHLQRMGAVVIGREEYLRRLPAALAGSTPFDPSGRNR
ncbi:MAG: leucyl/phenylalanyl-tRNA--protein transferase [Actinobacteria bacterium]|mgnify:CR=1 FL=1|nr:MAG: leucyl/phenylalanyl-tRNA--protein transferase [Actinomycetota bacterium]